MVARARSAERTRRSGVKRPSAPSAETASSQRSLEAAWAMPRKPIALAVIDRVSFASPQTHFACASSPPSPSAGSTTLTRAASSRKRLVFIVLRGAIF